MSGIEAEISSRVRRFGQVLYDRATGDADEMESAKSVCEIVSRFYEPGMRILDVGCGAGHYLRSLRERIDPDIDYTGIDITAHYIELAQKAFPEIDGFSIGDASELTFADESFDIVLCMNVVPNLPPPPTAAIKELLRVSRNRVVIRTLFADITYIIRELTPQEHSGGGPFTADGRIDESQAIYNNMYPEAYLREVIADADPDAAIEVERDVSNVVLDNRTSHGSWGTHTEGGKQISGQLILDWRYAIVERAEGKRS